MYGLECEMNPPMKGCGRGVLNLDIAHAEEMEAIFQI